MSEPKVATGTIGAVLGLPGDDLGGGGLCQEETDSYKENLTVSRVTKGFD